MADLIVIPARGGSKGIPLKNIYPVKGIPLLEYTLESVAGIREEYQCDIVVSTDSGEIAGVAGKYSDVTVIERPAAIAQDASSTEAALLHALEYMEEHYQKEYQNVITLQPTSPLRKPETIRRFIDEFHRHASIYDAQLTLTESRSDYWIKNSEGHYERLFKMAPRRRQDREPVYIENSAIYMTSVQALKATKSVLGTKVNGFIIDETESIDINEMSDIKLAESYL